MVDEEPRSLFKSRTEEAVALTRELEQIRDLLRDISTRVNNIERHVKRAFALPPKPKVLAGSRNVANDVSSMSTTDALNYFQELVALAKGRGTSPVGEKLKERGAADLRRIAEELGLPSGVKTSRKDLVASIVGRVQESVLLSSNRNVTLPRSAEDAGNAGNAAMRDGLTGADKKADQDG